MDSNHHDLINSQACCHYITGDRGIPGVGAADPPDCTSSLSGANLGQPVADLVEDALALAGESVHALAALDARAGDQAVQA